jgi:hypothetical protein
MNADLADCMEDTDVVVPRGYVLTGADEQLPIYY